MNALKGNPMASSASIISVTTGVATPLAAPVATPRRSLTLAYAGIILFFLVYYIRPNDWIPALETFPVAKIAAGIAVLGIGVALLREPGAIYRALRQSAEFKGMVVLYVWMWLTVPFAIWRGGSFMLLATQFSSVLLITMLIGITAASVKRMTALLYIPALTLTVMSGFAIRAFYLGGNLSDQARIQGALEGAFANPNDLALNFVLALPFVIAFALISRATWLKLLWTAAAFALSVGILVTFSRGGFLAFFVVVAISVIDIGFRSRKYALVMAALLVVGAAGAAVVPSGYGDRLGTIFSPSSDPTGSSQERLELLQRSLQVTAERPLYGIGPGNFPTISGLWRNTHNTYTQLTSEAGIPALLIFLWIVWKAFGRLHRTIASARDERLVILTKATRACLAALVVSGFFYHNAYQYFTFFLFGYTVAFSRIALAQTSEAEAQATVATVAIAPDVPQPSSPVATSLPAPEPLSRFERYAHLYFKESQ